MATSQNYTWPSSSDVTLTGSPNGAPIPSTSILIAGENPAGNQQVLQTTSDGSLLVSPDPTSTGNVNLTEVSGVAITLGQKASAASLPVVIASDQSTLPISAASLPLPAGAATSANQTIEISSLATIATNTTGVSTAANQSTGNTTLSNIQANQTNGTQVTNITGTVPLPTGAATAALQTSGNASLSTIATNTTGVSTAANQATEISSLASIVTNTIGIATAANQSTANTTLSAIDANQTNGTQKAQLSNPTAQTITSAALAIGTSAVRLTVSGSAPSATIGTRIITPIVTSAANFYIGGSGVTSGSGAAIVAGQVITLNQDACDYFMVSDTAAQTVYITQEGT